jgi:hypothetical protein
MRYYRETQEFRNSADEMEAQGQELSQQDECDGLARVGAFAQAIGAVGCMLVLGLFLLCLLVGLGVCLWAVFAA